MQESQTQLESPPGRYDRKGLIAFGAALVLIVLLRLLIGLVSIPSSLLPLASIVISVLFIAIPILGFYRGASYPWSVKSAILLIVAGAVMQVVLGFSAGAVGVPFLRGLLLALSQTGLLLWSFGLGALLASIIRDKNLLLPVAIFLALFDIWLVFAPEGVAGQATRDTKELAGQVFTMISYQVLEPVSRPSGGFARPMAYVGPADFLFLAMFFVALYKFRMRTRATFIAMVPTLAAYLLVVLLFRDAEIGPFRLGALPALLPIGAVILAVNWREFKLTRDEIISTLLVLVLGTAVVTWRLVVSHNQPEPPVESSQPESGPGDPESAGSPVPEAPGSPP